MERPEKRKRFSIRELEDRCSEAEGAEAGFERLSDELLAHVFSFIPLNVAWRLRSVCKAWREIIQVSIFPNLDMSTKNAAHLSELAALFSKSSVQLKLENVSLALQTDGLSDDESFDLWGSALEVLSALTSKHARRGPKVVDLSYSTLPIDDRLDNADPAHSLVLAVLVALRPLRKKGPDASAPLQKLHLKLSVPDFEQMDISSSTFRAFLAPFSNLTSMELPTDWLPIGRAQAAVLAECCPRLACLTMTPASANAVARLAPLPLERLTICDYTDDLRGSLTALSAGRAGETLKYISTDSKIPFPRVNREDLRAMARFPELLCLQRVGVSEDVSREDVAALGAAPKLSTLVICFAGDVDATPFLWGLADAARASRSIKKLSLFLEAPSTVDPAALKDCLTAASRVLYLLELHVKRPLTAGEVFALAGCRRADFSSRITCRLDSSADLLALDRLRGARVAARIELIPLALLRTPPHPSDVAANEAAAAAAAAAAARGEEAVRLQLPAPSVAEIPRLFFVPRPELEAGAEAAPELEALRGGAQEAAAGERLFRVKFKMPAAKAAAAIAADSAAARAAAAAAARQRLDEANALFSSVANKIVDE
eukprot:tig00021621_g22979.t1